MRQSLYQRIGEDRFKNLTETMSVPQMCVLLCTHHTKDELRAKCGACRRAVYRSIKALKDKEQKEKSLDIIDKFDQIPEIQNLIEFLKARQREKSQKDAIAKVRTLWQMIRESDRQELVQNQRPALWDERHVQYLIARIKERGVALYSWKQALRRLFESLGRPEMLKHNLLRARRRDMRSPKAMSKKRVKDYAEPDEFERLLEACDTDKERLKLKVHVTLKCREGGQKHHRESGASFCNLRWERVNWRDIFYGADIPKATITVFETKTGGGTLWEHCPLDLYWHSLAQEFRAYWESQGSPREGFVWGEDTYPDYLAHFKKLRERTGLNLTPHDMRNTGATWLHDQGADNLAIGQYDATRGRAIGFGGVGWENAEIYFQRYGRLSGPALRKLWKHIHEQVSLNGDRREGGLVFGD